mmetsp:Transcript_27691/g.58832  ORF Transcript_27691/g.58832 Transcript_27691/m.58832 type:complete len:97 (-) Transcript_27691:532-822(-)
MANIAMITGIVQLAAVTTEFCHPLSMSAHQSKAMGHTVIKMKIAELIIAEISFGLAISVRTSVKLARDVQRPMIASLDTHVKGNTHKVSMVVAPGG